MAKSSDEIKKIVDKLTAAIGSMHEGNKESVNVNRQLLKVISLLNAGFARNERDAEELISKVKAGLQVTDDVAKKWAKERGATQRDIEDITFKFRKLEKLHNTINDLAQDHNDILEERNEFLDEELDFADKLFKTHDDIVRTLKKSNDIVAKIGSGTVTLDDVMGRMVKKNIDLNRMFGDMFDSMEMGQDVLSKLKEDSQSMIAAASGMGGKLELNFAPNSASLNKALNDVRKSVEIENKVRLAGLLNFFSQNETLQQNAARKFAADMSKGEIKFNIDTGAITTELGELKAGMQGFEEALSTLDKLVIDTNAVSKVQNSFLEITDLFALGASRTEEQSEHLKKVASSLDIGTQILVEQHILRQKDLIALNQSVEAEYKRHEAMAKYSTQLIVSENVVRRIGDATDAISAMLPSGISRMLGLSKISFALIEGHQKGVENFFMEIGKGGDKAKALQAYFKSFGPILRTVITPATIIIASFGVLYALLKKVTGEYKEIATNLGLSLNQAKQFKTINNDIFTSQRNQYLTSEEILAVQKEMIGSSGNLSSNLKEGNKDLIISLGEMGQAFGYGAEQAVKIHKVFTDLGANDELGKNLQNYIVNMAEVANLSPDIITKDLLDASEEVYTYFAGMPEKAADAAIQVRRFGFSLKQAGQLTQKMLDLEGFMTDMYELRAMTGPGGIDFSKAFEAGLTGEFQDMTKYAIEAIGGLQNFQKMDPLVRMKTAKTLGMSVEELTKSVTLHDKMKGLTQDQQAILSANYDTNKELHNLQGQALANRLNEINKVNQLDIAWEKIKTTFAMALLPLAESFVGIIDSITPLLEVVIGLLKGIGGIFKFIKPLLEGMVLPFQFIGHILTTIVEKINNFFDGLGGVKQAGDEVNKTLEYTNWALKGIGVVISSMFIIKKVLGMFGMFGDTVDGASNKTSGLIGMFGRLFKGVLMNVPLIGDVFKRLFKNIEKDSEAASKKMQKDSADSGKAIESNGRRSFGRLAGLAGGIFAAMNSKLIFGSIQSVGAKIFGKMGIDFGMSMAGIEPAAVDSLGRVKEEGIDTFGTIGIIGSGLLANYLQYGVEKFIQKKFEKVFESNTDGVFKRTAKKFGKLGDAFADRMRPATSKVSDMFAKLVQYGAEKFPKIAGMLTKGFEKTTPVLDKIKEKVMSMLPKKKEEQITEKVQEKIKDKVTETISETKVETPEPEKAQPAPMQETKVEKPKKQVHVLDKVAQNIKKGFNVISTTITSALKVVKDAIGAIIDIVNVAADKLSKGISTMVKNLMKGIADATSYLKPIAKSLGDAMTEIAKGISGVLKTLSSGIGETIKNILKGIGDGLSSFNTKALIGATSMLVLSAALFVTAKAVKEFTSVKWDDMLKAGVALGGLAIMSKILSSAAGNMIVGALAIAALGLALIPAAYAFGEFNKVEWASLAKAGIAIAGLAVAAAILGPLLPLMALGALAIAALGASLIPLAVALRIAAPAMEDFGKGMATIISSIGDTVSKIITSIADAIGSVIVSIAKGVSIVTESLTKMAGIDALNLIAVAGGVTALGIALAGFSALNLSSGIASAIGKIFGGGPIDDLKALATLADPLTMVGSAISLIAQSLLIFSDILQQVDFDRLDALKEISKIEPAYKFKIAEDESNVQIQDTDRNAPAGSFGISPNFNQFSGRSLGPSRESVAQNLQPMVRPLEPPKEAVAQNVMMRPTKGFTPEEKTESNTSTSDYEVMQDSMSTRNLERLMREMIQALHVYSQRPLSVELDGYSVNKVTKKYNNN